MFVRPIHQSMNISELAYVTAVAIVPAYILWPPTNMNYVDF
jgi:hypothetical protein